MIRNAQPKKSPERLLREAILRLDEVAAYYRAPLQFQGEDGEWEKTGDEPGLAAEVQAISELTKEFVAELVRDRYWLDRLRDKKHPNA